MRSIFVFILALTACQPKENAPVPAVQVDGDEEGKDTGTLLSEPNTGDLVLGSVGDVFPSEGNKLIGGSIQDPKAWPASFTTRQGNSRCTGTMIGPRTLQLAAHCVGNGRTASITSEGKTYPATCTHSPKYKTDATADYALCLLKEELGLPHYERILQEPRIKVGEKLILAGMGCTIAGGTGGNDGNFRVGESPIIRLPKYNNDIVTKGGAALCFGDSGGSVFWKDPDGLLWVAGVNSRGDIATTSYLSATFTSDAKEFYGSWAKQNSASICGVDPEAKNCRGSEQSPPQKPLPESCQQSLDKIHGCLFGVPRGATKNYGQCVRAVTDILECLDLAANE
jgi:hypothetical protein